MVWCLCSSDVTVFFCKQRTAYDRRISDWSSDVCSSDLQPIAPLLSRIDSIRRDKDIPPAIAALHQVGIPVLFQFTPDVDLADLDRHIGYFTQGGLGLTDPTYYTRPDPDTQDLPGR